MGKILYYFAIAFTLINNACMASKPASVLNESTPDNAEVVFSLDRNCLLFNISIKGSIKKLCKGDSFQAVDGDRVVIDFDFSIPQDWKEMGMLVIHYGAGTTRHPYLLGDVAAKVEETPGYCDGLFCIGKDVRTFKKGNSKSHTGVLNRLLYTLRGGNFPFAMSKFSYGFGKIADLDQIFFSEGCVVVPGKKQIKYCAGDKLIRYAENKHGYPLFNADQIGYLKGKFAVTRMNEGTKESLQTVLIDGPVEESIFSTNLENCKEFCNGSQYMSSGKFTDLYTIAGRNEHGVMVKKYLDDYSFSNTEDLKTFGIKEGCTNWKPNSVCVGDSVYEPDSVKAIQVYAVGLDGSFVFFKDREEKVRNLLTRKEGACINLTNICVGYRVFDQNYIWLGTIDAISLSDNDEPGFPKQIRLTRDTGIFKKVLQSELDNLIFQECKEGICK